MHGAPVVTPGVGGLRATAWFWRDPEGSLCPRPALNLPRAGEGSNSRLHPRPHPGNFPKVFNKAPGWPWDGPLQTGELGRLLGGP